MIHQPTYSILILSLYSVGYHVPLCYFYRYNITFEKLLNEPEDLLVAARTRYALWSALY